MKEKTFAKSIGSVFIYILIVVVLIPIFALVGAMLPGIIKDLFLILGELLSLYLVIKLTKPNLLEEFKDYKTNFKSNIKKSLLYWIIGFALMLISNIIIVYVLKTNMAENEQANRELLSILPLYSIIRLSIFAPLCEELIFRYNFKGTLKNKTLLIIITGIIFGSIHVLLNLTSTKQLLYLIPYGILGISFSLAYFKTDNIWSSIFAHMLHNSLTLLLILFNL